MIRRRLTGCLGAFFLAVVAHAQPGVTARLAAIPRGDELAVTIQAWPVRLRLHGVAVPKEPALLDGRACAYLRRRIGAGALRVVVRGTASKNILYADVYAPPGAKTSLNDELVRVGLAQWSKKYAPGRTDLQRAEERARAAGRGFWSDPTGANVPLPAIPRIAPRRTLPPPPRPRGAVAPRRPGKVVARPLPRKLITAPRPVRRRAPLGIAGGVLALALLLVAGRLCQPAARIRGAPRRLVADRASGLMKIRGVARAREGILVSATGRVPALFLHETIWRYAPTGAPGRRERRWTKLRDERECIPFVVDDGSGEARVEAKPEAVYPLRIARYYNEVPVGRWHEPAYGDDTRALLRLLPSDAPVTVVGRGEWRDERLTIRDAVVIEGDEGIVGRARARGGLTLAVCAVALAIASVVLAGS